jgi:hypothetical protein
MDEGVLLSIKQEAAGAESAARYQELENARTASRPSMILRPSICRDGDAWCALFGKNIQEGVVGYGDSPELAYQDFDRAWVETIKTGEGETR